MKYKMDLKLNLGNYQSATLGIDEADDFETCRKEIQKDIIKLVENGFDPLALNENVLAFIGMKIEDLMIYKEKDDTI